MESSTALAAPGLESYGVRNLGRILTPALAVYSEFVDANVSAALRLLGGNADRWRPHIKTAKLSFILRRLIELGVSNFKCATTLELFCACHSGARDVLVAYPVQGANALRVREIALQFPVTRVSALVDTVDAVAAWGGGTIGIFVDINSGMNRTGIAPQRTEEVLRIVQAIRAARLEFRGLHFYDGHLHQADLAERTTAAHLGYDQLMHLVAALAKAGVDVPEVITAGTPSLPCSLSYAGFREAGFLHRVSPGTIVYGDATSLAQLPHDFGFRPAVLVIARVVSRPAPDIITCDAGHKSVSADSGVPTCAVIGHPDFVPLGPSEEHLPIQVPVGAAMPAIGDFLYLLPRHVCPTVNNFDEALIVRNGKAERVERVTARGRETLLRAAAPA
jgi:D-serine deaminase-like pyridoxal phosphate-dependent protein